MKIKVLKVLVQPSMVMLDEHDNIIAEINGKQPVPLYGTDLGEKLDMLLQTMLQKTYDDPDVKALYARTTSS